MKILERYFLPSPTPSVHAATIEFWKGYPVFSWFGGTQEGFEDVAIYIYNLNNDKKTIVIGNKDAYPRWNPILFNHDNNLYLFEKIGIFCDRWQTFIHNVTKWDNEITEKEVRANQYVLPTGLNGPVKLRPVVIKSDIFCGSSQETFYDWTSYIERYKIDNGKWKFQQRSNPLNIENKVLYRDQFNGSTKVSMGVIQPSLWIQNGKIKAFFRSSHGLNKIFYSENYDYDSYENWATPEATNLLNPNSGVSAVYCKDNLYLAYNPSTQFRCPLIVEKLKQKSSTLFENNDVDGILIENKPEMYAGFSYPYMIEHEGLLHLVYTYDRKRIEYVVIDPN